MYSTNEILGQNLLSHQEIQNLDYSTNTTTKETNINSSENSKISKEEYSKLNLNSTLTSDYDEKEKEAPYTEIQYPVNLHRKLSNRSNSPSSPNSNPDAYLLNTNTSIYNKESNSPHPHSSYKTIDGLLNSTHHTHTQASNNLLSSIRKIKHQNISQRLSSSSSSSKSNNAVAELKEKKLKDEYKYRLSTRSKNQSSVVNVNDIQTFRRKRESDKEKNRNIFKFVINKVSMRQVRR